MTSIQLEEIGRLADKADNLVAASQLRLPPQVHVECLSAGLKDISSRLKAIVREVSGEDPWEFQP